MTWTIDTVPRRVGFSIEPMVVAPVRGRFDGDRGAPPIDPNDVNRSPFEGEVDVASIDTGNAARDNHLRTGEFFDTLDRVLTRMRAVTNVTGQVLAAKQTGRPDRMASEAASSNAGVEKIGEPT